MIKNLIRSVTVKNLAVVTLCFVGFSAAQGQTTPYTNPTGTPANNAANAPANAPTAYDTLSQLRYQYNQAIQKLNALESFKSQVRGNIADCQTACTNAWAVLMRKHMDPTVTPAQFNALMAIYSNASILVNDACSASDDGSIAYNCAYNNLAAVYDLIINNPSQAGNGFSWVSLANRYIRDSNYYFNIAQPKFISATNLFNSIR